MKWCCHVWAGAPSCYLEMLDKLKKRICRSISSFAVSLEFLGHCRNVAKLSLCYKYYFGRCSSKLTQQVPLLYSRGRSTRYSERLHDCMSPFLDVKKNILEMIFSRVFLPLQFHVKKIHVSRLPCKMFKLTKFSTYLLPSESVFSGVKKKS